MRLTQWEIEYKGRIISDDRENTDVFQCISHEIGEISSYIQQRFPGEVRPTTVTKFEWFMESVYHRSVSSLSRKSRFETSNTRYDTRWHPFYSQSILFYLYFSAHFFHKMRNRLNSRA